MRAYRFQHTCDKCQFIRQSGSVDVWYCHNAGNQSLSWVIGRWGNERWECWNMTLDEVEKRLGRINPATMGDHMHDTLVGWRDKPVSYEWLSLSEYEQDCEYYSDVFKERHGFRPRSFPPADRIGADIQEMFND